VKKESQGEKEVEVKLKLSWPLNGCTRLSSLGGGFKSTGGRVTTVEPGRIHLTLLFSIEWQAGAQEFFIRSQSKLQPTVSFGKLGRSHHITDMRRQPESTMHPNTAEAPLNIICYQQPVEVDILTDFSH
jgi:hypothetical protein